MPFTGRLDRVSPFLIHGWVDNEAFPSPPFVDIVVNRRFLGTVRSGLFRHDLKAAKVADGQRAFWFNPYEFLQPGANRIEVFVAGSDQLLDEGSRDLHFDPAQVLHSYSGRRETSVVPKPMTGASFLEQAARLFPFESGTRILEIDSAHGRLLKTILERGISFQQFVGLETSKSRTDKLNAEFGDPRRKISFTQGDLLSFSAPERSFELVICSCSAEYWFPSIAATLAKLYNLLNAGGVVLMDFPCYDSALETSFAHFEEQGGEGFSRIYSGSELRAFFGDAGFEVTELIYPMTIRDVSGMAESKRALVAARKPEVTA